jgi:hypothetical protein
VASEIAVAFIGGGAGSLNLLTLAFTLIALRWSWAHRHQLIDEAPASEVRGIEDLR